MSSRPRPEVHEVRADEVDRVAGALGRAFFDDPVMTWLQPSADARRRLLRGVFRSEVQVARRHGVALTTDDLGAAALWYPPGTWSPAVIRRWRGLVTFARAYGRHLGRGQRLTSTTQQAHPHHPHWYLYVLGTDPERQGRGLGAALLAAGTARADEADLPCYLESSKEANVPYYRRAGFDVTAELLPPGGPTLWAMARPPHGIEP